MALTPAERKANQMARKQEIMDTLVATNSALTAENAKLQETVKLLTEKIHKMELAALRLQLKSKT